VVTVLEIATTMRIAKMVWNAFVEPLAILLPCLVVWMRVVCSVRIIATHPRTITFVFAASNVRKKIRAVFAKEIATTISSAVKVSLALKLRLEQSRPFLDALELAVVRRNIDFACLLCKLGVILFLNVPYSILLWQVLTTVTICWAASKTVTVQKFPVPKNHAT